MLAKISLGALNLQLDEARGLGFRVLGLRVWSFGVFGVFGIGAQKAYISASQVAPSSLEKLVQAGEGLPRHPERRSPESC